MPSTDKLSEMGFLRSAVVCPELRVADVDFNTAVLLGLIERAAAEGIHLVVTPELGITGYSCADLFYQHNLLRRAAEALVKIALATAETGVTILVGLPLESHGRLYNCAALCGEGRVLGLIPKTYLPTYGEFYEERWFTGADNLSNDTFWLAKDQTTWLSPEHAAVPFGADLLFEAADLPHCVLGVEICEDLWAVIPPSSEAALAGATVLLNPSASDELLGKKQYREGLVVGQSARTFAAYLYAGAGPGESTTDVVYSGHCMIAENGNLLAETARFQFTTQWAVADLDLLRLRNERLHNTSFGAARSSKTFRTVSFKLLATTSKNAVTPAAAPKLVLHRPLSPTPFVPSAEADRARVCEEIFHIQATGLAKRLRHSGIKRATIGLSGGLDSTLAVLVAVRAFEEVGLPRQGILAITMPGMGTTGRTKSNAQVLAEKLGLDFEEIPIGPAVAQHFKDIKQPADLYDIVYENSQARERTQILMDKANQIGGLVLGTGDLSELALGWCSYNGDHMSMYNVNASIPKTLIKYLVAWCAHSDLFTGTAAVLTDIYDTPISPELLPIDAKTQVQHQETEKVIGPYKLHDFFLYYAIRHSFPPPRVFFLAQLAFAGEYGDAEIIKWLETFYWRFFSQQFKRSAMPDGPKVGTVALSPRGDWRMPSDASARLWLDEVAEIKAKLGTGIK